MYSRILRICMVSSLVLNAGTAYSAEQDENCLMDVTAIARPAFFSDKDFSKAQWDDKKKIATFTTVRNEVFVVKYSACENFGVDGELSTDLADPKALTQELIASQVRWIARKIFYKQNKSEIAAADNIENAKQFKQFFTAGIYNKKPMLFAITNDSYSDAVLKVFISDKKLVVTLTTVSQG